MKRELNFGVLARAETDAAIEKAARTDAKMSQEKAKTEDSLGRERGVVPDFRRTQAELQSVQEVASHFADTTEGEERLRAEGYDRTPSGRLHDLGKQVVTAEESFSETMRKKETGGVSEEAGQQPDWSRMSQEMLDTRHETLMQKIGDLRARQMALDDALDAPSIQELSRVNQELTMREVTLASLRKHMGK